MNQANRVTNQNQKIVFVTQRSQTPVGSVQQVPSSQNQSNTVVKFVSNAATLNQQKIVTSQQKLGIAHVQQQQPGLSMLPKVSFQQVPSKKIETSSVIEDLTHLE